MRVYRDIRTLSQPGDKDAKDGVKAEGKYSQ